MPTPLTPTRQGAGDQDPAFEFRRRSHNPRLRGHAWSSQRGRRHVACEQIVADVTLPDAPEGINLCFRGPKNPSTTTEPRVLTYCDNAPTNDEGAFSVVTDGDADDNELDVHAFVRVAKNGGADVLATRLDVLNLPRVVQGTFNKDGKIVFGGFENANARGVGEDPDGIDRDLVRFRQLRRRRRVGVR